MSNAQYRTDIEPMNELPINETVSQYAQRHQISVADVYCMLNGMYKELGMHDEAQRCFNQFMFLTFGE